MVGFWDGLWGTDRYDLVVSGKLLIAEGGRARSLLWGRDETAKGASSYRLVYRHVFAKIV